MALLGESSLLNAGHITFCRCQEAFNGHHERQEKDNTHQMHFKETKIDGSSSDGAAPSTGEAPASVTMADNTSKTTLVVRKTSTGLTSLLTSHADGATSSGLRVLVEPAYGKAITFRQAGQAGSQSFLLRSFPIFCALRVAWVLRLSFPC